MFVKPGDTVRFLAFFLVSNIPTRRHIAAACRNFIIELNDHTGFITLDADTPQVQMSDVLTVDFQDFADGQFGGGLCVHVLYLSG